jgi:hypothetical protein
MKLILFVMALTVPLMAVEQNLTSDAVSVARTGCTDMDQLIDFVAEATDHPPLQFCPNVRKSSVSELKFEFTKPPAYGWDPQAAYLPTSGEILINDEIDTASLLGRSFLLHEIVHAAQYNSGDIAPEVCTGLLESEAYRVQASYLEKHDLVKEATIFLWMSLLHKSACTQYDYYR